MLFPRHRAHLIHKRNRFLDRRILICFVTQIPLSEPPSKPCRRYASRFMRRLCWMLRRAWAHAAYGTKDDTSSCHTAQSEGHIIHNGHNHPGPDRSPTRRRHIRDRPGICTLGGQHGAEATRTGALHGALPIPDLRGVNPLAGSLMGHRRASVPPCSGGLMRMTCVSIVPPAC